jgi:hypothetical protein
LLTDRRFSYFPSNQKEGIMVKRFILGLLVMSVFVALGTEADAKVCLFRVDGECKFWSGGIGAQLNSSGLGNVNKDPKTLGFTAYPKQGGTTLYGLAYCGNPGKKQHGAPGQQFAGITGILGAVEVIAKKDVDDNGFAIIELHAYPSQAQLNQLEPICDEINPGWVAIDFVPNGFEVDVDLADELGNIIGQARFTCDLPNWQTLGWDRKRKAPEMREYDCGPL